MQSSPRIIITIVIMQSSSSFSPPSLLYVRLRPAPCRQQLGCFCDREEDVVICPGRGDQEAGSYVPILTPVWPVSARVRDVAMHSRRKVIQVCFSSSSDE